MVEVLVAAMLIFISLGGIFAMNARSIHILRTTRQVTASSLMAQQRIEAIRGHPWAQISTAAGLAELLRSPTESEKELADAAPVELITLSVPPTPGAPAAADVLRVRRQGGAVRIEDGGDLDGQSVLLVTVMVQWRGLHGTQERTRRTIVYRSGLTRSGIFGNTLGRPSGATPPAL